MTPDEIDRRLTARITRYNATIKGKTAAKRAAKNLEAVKTAVDQIRSGKYHVLAAIECNFDSRLTMVCLNALAVDRMELPSAWNAPTVSFPVC